MELLKDRSGRVWGKLEEINGVPTAFDHNGRKLGFYDSTLGRTRLYDGRIVGQGNLLSALVIENAGSGWRS